MFKENNSHKQTQIFGYRNKLDKTRLNMLEQGWPALFYSIIFSKIEESKFAHLYSDKPSRPNFPVNILLGLEILKQIFSLSDAELVERFHFDLRFLRAFGLEEIGEMSLCQRTIYEFRDRLAYHLKKEKNDLITELFTDLLNEFIEAAGISTTEQRMDSTMVRANIKQLSRIQLVYKVGVNLIESLPSEKRNKVHKNIIQLFTDEDNFRDYIDKLGREEALKNLCSKLYELKTRFKNDEEINKTKAYKQLCRVIEDQTVVSSQEITIKKDEDIEPDSLQNPVDEDATYRKKGNKSSQGYAVNISETANEDNPFQLITNISVKPNIYSDVDFLKDDLKILNEITDIDKLVTDGGYHSSSDDLDNNEDVDIHTTNLTGRNPEYSTADFELDEQNGILFCPRGIKPVRDKYLENSDTYAAWFLKETCENCELRDECPIVEQKKSMTVRFTGDRHQNDILRQEMEKPESKELQRSRPAIEGTISALKRSLGLDRFDFRGLLKAYCSAVFKAIGYNLKQIAKAVSSGLISKEKLNSKINS